MVRLLRKKSNTYALILQKRKKSRKRYSVNTIFPHHHSSKFKYKFFKRYLRTDLSADPEKNLPRIAIVRKIRIKNKF